jgi:hypothetical protein
MSTSTSTSTLDSLVADFERRLGSIDKSSLQQWQFAYKQVIFAMGLKILEQFPRNAFGPEPIAEGHGGSQGPGGGPVIHRGGGAPGPGGGPIIHQPAGGLGGGPIIHQAGGPGGGPIIHLATAALELAPPPPPPPPPAP